MVWFYFKLLIFILGMKKIGFVKLDIYVEGYLKDMWYELIEVFD